MERPNLEFPYLNSFDKAEMQRTDLSHPLGAVVLDTEDTYRVFRRLNRQYLGHGQTVTCLFIAISKMKREELDILPLLIRNLDELYMYYANEHATLRLTSALSPHPWSRTIRIIQEPCTTFTRNILRLNPCPLLTSISISGRQMEVGNGFIDLLTNAPALRTLSLKKVRISLNDLEELHENVLGLNSLLICESVLRAPRLLQEADIRPAITVTKLSLKDVVIPSYQGLQNLQEYLIEKYTHVTDLTHVVTTGRVGPRMDIFRNLARRIGFRLASLEFGTIDHYRGISDVLVENNCRPARLNLDASTHEFVTEQLQASTLSHSVQTLFLTKIDDATFIQHLNNFRVLTELVLDCARIVRINMQNLLQIVGNTLQTLNISRGDLSIEQWTRTGEQAWHGLQTLILKNSSSSQAGRDLTPFISRAFPRLTSLTIAEFPRQNITFQLLELDLQYLEVRVKLTLDQYVQVETNAGIMNYTAEMVNKHRKTDPFNGATFPGIRVLGNQDGIPSLTFQCNSVNAFVLVNTSAR